MAFPSKTTMSHPTTDPNSPNTTFVQADPSTFRTIVQQLTGASSSSDPSLLKLPLAHRASAADVIGPKKPVFKLHERRQSIKKLEIKLHNNNVRNESPSDFLFVGQRGFLVSPVSTLDFLPLVSPSPKTKSMVDEEEEKGFYLQQSPLNMTRRGAEPELLPLFPLHSPRENIER